MKTNIISPDFIFCVPLKLSFLIAFLKGPKSDLNAWLRWWHSGLESNVCACVHVCVRVCVQLSVNTCEGFHMCINTLVVMWKALLGIFSWFTRIFVFHQSFNHLNSSFFFQVLLLRQISTVYKNGCMLHCMLHCKSESLMTAMASVCQLHSNI